MNTLSTPSRTNFLYVPARLRIPDEPIVTSLTDTDFYKFTMGQFIFNHFKKVNVAFGFKNRTLNVPLGRIIPESKLREELDHVRTLRFTNSELHYLRGTNEYASRMFKEPYLEWLSHYQAPEYLLEYKGDMIELSFPDPYWCDTSPWEIHGMEIMNELYFREIMRKHSITEIDVIYAEGKKRLWEKIKILKDNPQIIFSEFGTRRRFSRFWQDYVVAALTEELPASSFRGTSNVAFAQKYGIMPMGTNAHELQMVTAVLMDSVASATPDDNLRASVNETFKLWWAEYGEPLSVFLPDTFGTDSFLANVEPEMLSQWKGFRQDSGDPIAEGEQWIKSYEKYGIDSRKKMMVPSDGLDLQKMLEIEKHFRGRLMVSFGWGTNLTNDVGFQTLSLVIKATRANGRSTVKLSNNPAKAMGNPKDVERYMKVFGYDPKTHKFVQPKY